MSTPIGPYSPVVSSGEWRVCSGQLGLVPASAGGPPVLVDGGAAAQLTQALANAAQLLGSVGSGLDDVVKTTVFVTDMGGYPAVNQAYAAAFGDHRPARSVVGVTALPMGALVEVELWARVGAGRGPQG